MSRLSRLLLVSLLALGGCKRPQIVTYVAPKDPAASHEESHAEEAKAPSAPSPRGAEAERPPAPTLGYKAPPNWVTGPRGDVTAVNFLIKGEGGEATVSVSPLGSFAGRETAIVNMWRGMAGAPALSDDEALKQFTPFDIAGEPAQLFEVSGSRDGKTSRIVTAMLHRPEGTWFFKLSGDDAVVASQKETFLAFLKTVQFGGPQASETASAAPAKTPAPTPAAAPAPVTSSTPISNPDPTPITNPAAAPAPATPPPTAVAIPVATPAPTHANPAATPTATPAIPATPAPVLKAPPATPAATPAAAPAPAPAPTSTSTPANPAP